MSHTIGFKVPQDNSDKTKEIEFRGRITEPRNSVVRVFFPDEGKSFVYFNDKFDLHCGDYVFVEGVLDGVLGRVVDVKYNFKIKVSDYKRVVSVADTDICGTLYMSDSYFFTFNRSTIPFSKIITWFKVPETSDDIAIGYDESVYSLNNLNSLEMLPFIAERGYNYYRENRIKYVCIDKGKGIAIVEGSDIYEVEFEYDEGNISKLTCSCYCECICKHEFALMLLLKDFLAKIEGMYVNEYKQNAYFAVISKSSFFNFAVDGKHDIMLTLNGLVHG